MIRWWVAAVVGLTLVGCQSAPEAGEPVAKPPKETALIAKQDPALVGTWRLKTGAKTDLTLNADGTSRIKSEVKTPGGTMKSDLEGQWGAENGTLTLRRRGPEGDFTTEYSYKIDGDSLEVSRVGTRAKQVYRRVEK